MLFNILSAELAARLQAEEDAQAAHHAIQQPAQHHGNARPIPSGNHGQQRSGERDNTRDRERPKDISKDKGSNVCMSFQCLRIIFVK